MRYLVWLLRIALFVVLLGFAVKNSDVVTVRFFFDAAWPLPLVAVMVLFFAAGAVAGCRPRWAHSCASAANSSG